MVVKVCNRENQVPNRTENIRKGRRTPSKSLKKSSTILGSPSRPPLGSSSLTNITNNTNGAKFFTQFPKTPIKQEPHTTPSKCQFPSSGILTPMTSEKYEIPLRNIILPESPSDSSDDSSLIDTGSIAGTSSSAAADSCKNSPPVSRRNARERNRVKQVSMGFTILRQHVPQGNRKKKLSKVETLRSAVEYIRNMKKLLQEHPHPIQHSSIHQSFLSNAANVQVVVPAQQQNQQTFYDDRLHQQMQQQNNNLINTCVTSQNINIDSHVLKIPKIENQNLVSPVYTSNLYHVSGMTFVKASPDVVSGHSQIYLENEKIPESNQQISYDPSGVKDATDVELLDALDWWQQNA